MTEAHKITKIKTEKKENIKKAYQNKTQFYKGI